MNTIPTAPGRLPLLGHALSFARDPLDFLTSLPPHGDLVRIYLGTRPAYVVCGTEAAHQMLLDSRTFDKGGPFFDALRELLDDGLGTSTYEPHRQQRRVLQPSFHRDEIRGYADVMVKEINAEIDGWHDGDVIDVFERLFAVSIRVIARTLLLAETTDTLIEQTRLSLASVFSGIFWRMVDPTGRLSSLPTPGNRRYDRAERRLRAIVDSIIAAGSPDGDNMLSSMLAARADDGTRLMSDSEIHHHILTFLFTGTEVPIAIVAWAVYLLARDPEAMRKLSAETDPARPVGPADLADLVQTRNVAIEAMRMFPPGWLFSRIATIDTELAGHRVRAGESIFYSPYLLHHRADVFEQPYRFNPDRWSSETAAAQPNHVFAPFGAGARKCIGDGFGLQEITTFLATLATRCQWTLVSDAEVRPRPRVALRPAPFSIRVQLRKEA